MAQPLHIFRAGRHTAMSGQSLEFSEAQVSAIAAAYDPALHEAPIVIGQVDAAQGQMADVIMSGSAELKMSGAGAAGASITANTSGLGVAAAAGAGNEARECPIFCVTALWSMLLERSEDDDDIQGITGRT
ncbi:hypothetical protein ACSSV6_002357, partial [Roseovarius sp. MBR-38]